MAYYYGYGLTIYQLYPYFVEFIFVFLLIAIMMSMFKGFVGSVGGG